MDTYLQKFLVLVSYSTAAILLFSAPLRYQGDGSSRDRVSRDAEALAKAAHNFDQAPIKGESRAEVEDEYRRVAVCYEQLHNQLAAKGYAAQNRRKLENFDRVTGHGQPCRKHALLSGSDWNAASVN